MKEDGTKNILVIDDDLPLLLGVQILLQRNGYIVRTSQGSLAGIKIAEETPPDLILCDIMMPVMNGFKVREILAANPLTSRIPFLFLTARMGQADKVHGLESGADDYITKPFDPNELLARIQAVFRSYDRGRVVAEHEFHEQVDRIKTEISHNFSHEMRTPMTQILISLEMVLRQKYDDPEELKWFVETALSQSHRLNALIDDLTFLNNTDLNPRPFLRQTVDLQNDFFDPISLRRTLYEDKKLQVEIRVDKDLTIHAPRREFRQACVHLVDNGLKFTKPETSVLVELTGNGDGGCILTVRDQGPGIPIEMREKVFEPYYQISQGDTRQFSGLGVGLTIARVIARSLGGDVIILPTSRNCRIQMVIAPGPLDLI